MIMEPLMATAAEATDMLRVGRSAVYRLIAARQRESIKIGRSQRASVASTSPTSRPRVRRFGGAVPHVVVGAFLGLPGLHRQRLLGPVQGLDLGFLVDAEHDRVLRRVEVQPDHIGDLGDQLGIGGELERTPLSNYIDALH